MMKKNRKRNGIYREKDFYIFVGLWIIGFIAFTLIPMGYSLYASFTKWDGVSAPQFNGVQNYIRMFVQVFEAIYMYLVINAFQDTF